MLTNFRKVCGFYEQIDSKDDARKEPSDLEWLPIRIQPALEPDKKQVGCAFALSRFGSILRHQAKKNISKRSDKIINLLPFDDVFPWEKDGEIFRIQWPGLRQRVVCCADMGPHRFNKQKTSLFSSHNQRALMRLRNWRECEPGEQ